MSPEEMACSSSSAVTTGFSTSHLQARSQEFAQEGAVSEVQNQTEILYTLLQNWNGFVPKIS